MAGYRIIPPKNGEWNIQINVEAPTFELAISQLKEYTKRAEEDPVKLAAYIVRKSEEENR